MFPLRPRPPIADHDRVVLAHHLSEIAGGRQVVVQAAVDHQKVWPRETFRSTTSADVNSGLADQITAEFDHARHPAAGP
jgi:hypothetical protein